MPLWDAKDCSPPGSSVHVIFQERILECVAISFSDLPYTLGYIRIPLHYFVFQLAPLCHFDILPSIIMRLLLLFWSLLSVVVLQDSQFILYIFCSCLRISHFSREPCFLLLGNGIRNQDLSDRSLCSLLLRYPCF